MEFLDICKNRYSCRGFSDEPIEREEFDYIKQCVLNVPSARNMQPYRIIETEGEVMHSAISCAQINGANLWASSAKGFWVIVEERVEGMKNYAEIDSGILVATACYAAAEKGIGSVVIGYYDEDGLKKLLNIPESKRILLCLAMGKKEASPRNPQKKSVQELFNLNEYND